MRKKQSGKILCLFVLFLVLAVSSAGAGQVHAETMSGSCGTKATYEYDSSTKTLTIGGSGTVKASNEWDDISGSVKYLVIGDKITAIGSGAFGEFSALKSVTLGAKVTSIGSYAFEFCTKLSSVTFGKKLTTIGKYAFHGCTKLTGISLPSSLTEIGAYAFTGSGLKKITIPKNVTSIGTYAFGLCESLTKITVSSSNTTYSSKSGVLYNKAKTKLIVYPTAKSDTSFTVPDTVKTIGQYAFMYNANLKKITTGAKVTKISAYAFSECKALTTVTIGDKVKTIGTEAFYRCKKLKTLSIGSAVTTIDPNAFAYCTALTSVTIPNKVKTIGNWAFVGCTKLKTVEIGTGIKTIGVEAFGWCTALKTVTFKGSAPTFEVYEDEDLEEGSGSAFIGVTATIKYPSSKKSSWTKSLRKMLKAGAALDGGSLTFKTY